MRLALIACVIALSASTVFAGDKDKKPNKSGIAWETDYEVAKQKAMGEGKLILVDIMTESCHYCIEMETDTWPREDVKAFIADKVCVRLIPGNGKGAKKACDDFKVTGYPTTILVTPDGREIARNGGKLPPDSFVSSFQNKASQDLGSIDTDKDPKAAAEKLFVIATSFSAIDLGKRAADLAAKATNEEFKKAYEEQTKSWQRTSLWQQAMYHLKNNKKDDGIATLKTLLAAQPETKEGKDAKAMLKKMNVKLEEQPAPAK